MSIEDKVSKLLEPMAKEQRDKHNAANSRCSASPCSLVMPSLEDARVELSRWLDAYPQNGISILGDIHFCDSLYWKPGNGFATMDGEFTLEQLKALVVFMEANTKLTDG